MLFDHSKHGLALELTIQKGSDDLFLKEATRANPIHLSKKQHTMLTNPRSVRGNLIIRICHSTAHITIEQNLPTASIHIDQNQVSNRLDVWAAVSPHLIAISLGETSSGSIEACMRFISLTTER
jgi:hypothetical protein